MIQFKNILCIFFITILFFSCSSKRKSAIKENEAGFVSGVRINKTMAVFERLAEGRLFSDNYDKGIARDSVLPGTDEEAITTNFILNELLNQGISAGFETFPATAYRIMNSHLKVGDRKFTVVTLANSVGTYGTKSIFQYSLGNDKKKQKIVGELLFAGKGLKKDLDAFPDLENKILLIERSDVLTGWPTPVIEEAAGRGVNAILFYGYKGESFIKDALYLDSTYSKEIPVFSISYEDAVKVKQILAAGRKDVELASEVYISEQDTKNIIGYIRGNNFPDEYIMLGVHYDKYFAGARSSCTGVAALLEFVRAIVSEGFAHNRTIVVAFFGGHYSGISGYIPSRFNGSFSFLKKHPEVRDKLIAYINLDEIGGIGKPKYLFSSYDLENFSKKVLEDLNLHDRYSPKAGFPNMSDATPFILHGTSFLQFYAPNSVISFENTNYDTKKEIDRKNFKDEIEAIALALSRLDQLGIYPIQLSRIIDYSINSLNVNQKLLNWNTIDDLLDTLTITKRLTKKLEEHITETTLKVELSEYKNKRKFGDVASLSKPYNALLMEIRQKLYSKIFSISGDIDAWRMSFFIDQYVQDFTNLDSTIYALDNDDRDNALGFLEKVTTLGWGHYFSRDIYLRIMKSYHEKKPAWLEDSQTYNDSYLWDIWSQLAHTTAGSFTKEKEHLRAIKDDLRSKIQKNLLELKTLLNETNQKLKIFLEEKGVDLEGISDEDLSS